MITIIDKVNAVLGRAISWFALGMVVLMTVNVIMRYLFAAGDPWQQELVRFMHGMLFLGGAAYALQNEALVRVDVLYHNFSDQTKAWVNILGTLFLLYPVCFAMVYFTWGYVLNSWEIYEGSSEYKGMPGVFVFKSFMWVCGFTLAMQGAANILRSVTVLRNAGEA